MTRTIVQPFPVDSLVALLDNGLQPPIAGAPLPPYWHLAACTTPAASHEIGADGHPLSGHIGGAPEFPRRMFASGELTINRAPIIGETLEQIDSIVSTADKTGRSGPLRFVTWDSEFHDLDGSIVMVERRNIVYRPPSSGADQVRAIKPAGGPAAFFRFNDATHEATLQANPVALQRFSAATSNSHRIHYDHTYATTVEGYPGLVVHGPLLLLALLELVRKDFADRAVTSVSFTAMAPVFADEPVVLTAAGLDTGLRLTATSNEITAMTAHVGFGQ